MVGILYSSTSSNLIPPVARSISDHSASSVLLSEYAGFSTWRSFADTCCCTQETNTNPGESVELWLCPGTPGYHKQRLRLAFTSNGTLTSGLALRPFCSKHFSPGVGDPVMVDLSGGLNANWALQVPVNGSYSSISAWQRQNLW